MAISMMGILVLQRRSLERLIRCVINQRCGGIPMVRLNARAKWLRESPQNEARSDRPGFDVRSSRMKSVTSRSWFDVNAPYRRPSEPHMRLLFNPPYLDARWATMAEKM